MIKDSGGRVRSEQTPEEVAELLRREVSQLSPAEREALLLCLRELDDPAVRTRQDADQGGGPVRILDALTEGEYIRPMVDVRTFITDPFYLGATCDGLYPKLIDDMVELFEGGYKEAILTGSIGWGKTFFASIAVCRCLYEISCLRDPHRSFGLAKDTNISFVALSISEALAIKVVFENIATKLKGSPYFQEHFPPEETKKELRFPHKVWVAARSSTDTSALGLNVFGAILDEGNFFEPIRGSGAAAAARFGNKDKAQVLYEQLVRRMKSRFQRHGKLPGLMIVVSSKRTRDDFTAKRVKEAANDAEVFVRDYAVYDVKPEAFSKERFHVLVGNETTVSKILSPDEVQITRDKIVETGAEGLLVIDVPEDFRADFESDLEGSIRDIAGVETVSVSPFLQQRDRIAACVDKARKHPYTSLVWDQSKPGDFSWQRLAKRMVMRDGAETFEGWQPIHYPGVTRHAHIDPSLNSDATGVAVGCVIGYRNVDRRNYETNEVYTEPAPVIWVDFVLRIVPPLGGEIDHGKIRGLIYQFQSHGFPIGFVTMDQFNSAASLQKFAVKGIEAERLSVDRPPDAYDTLKSAIYEGRLLMYEYEPLLEELRTLQRDKTKNKIDHPKGGSKDVADALAGIVFTLTTRYRGAPMGIIRGISQHGDPVVDEQREAVEPNDFFMPFLTG